MDRKRILLVTGMSGAGTSTTLKTLEDLGWEVVDNLPLFLLNGLLEAAPPKGMEGKNRPLAISIGVRTRDFAPEQITQSIRRLNESPNLAIETLFLNCGGAELKRRYAETRHRHPLAADRAADDGIAHERALLAPVRDMADRLLDTTNMTSNDLGQWLRANYAVEGLSEPVLTVMSFGFSKGLPRNADLVFDMRFLRNRRNCDRAPGWTRASSTISATIPLTTPPWLRSRRCSTRWSRVTSQVENPISPSRSAVPEGDIGRFMSPNGSRDGCARAVFPPRWCIVI